MLFEHPNKPTAAEHNAMPDDEYEKYRLAWYEQFCHCDPAVCICLGPVTRRA